MSVLTVSKQFNLGIGFSKNKNITIISMSNVKKIFVFILKLLYVFIDNVTLIK